MYGSLSYEREGAYLQCNSRVGDYSVMKHFASSDVDLKCILCVDCGHGSSRASSRDDFLEMCKSYDSDRCIIARRNLPKENVLCWFDYKSFIPKDLNLTDDQFKDVVEEYEKMVNNDCNYGERTTEEIHQCKEERKQKFNDYVYGLSSGKILSSKLQNKMQQEQARLADETKKADCAQAREKAQNRLNQIKSSLGVDLIYEMEGKVVDFADNGIIISTDCSGIWNNSWLLGGWGALMAANCKEERSFIYTKDTDYATNDKFNNKGLLYQKVGNFKYTTVTGATMSIPAYKETTYKASEIKYKTYLKDEGFICIGY